RAAAGQILDGHAAVEAYRDVDRLHQLGGPGRKAPAPHGLTAGRGGGGRIGGVVGHMSDNPAGKPSAPLLEWVLWGVAGVGVAAVLYIIAQVVIQPGASSGLKSLAKGEMAKLEIPAGAGAAPANTFYDAEGKAIRLADL